MNADTIAKRLVVARMALSMKEARKVKQGEVAEKAGITQSMLCGYEKGNSVPRIDTLAILSTALQCDAAWLAFGDS